MWRHQTMCRQRMRRQNVASQENVASPSNVAPNNAAPKCGATGKCGVTKQCGAKQCSAKMWRHRKMRRHQTMWRQTMWRHMSSKCVFIMCLQRQVEKCVLFCQHREPFDWHGIKLASQSELRSDRHAEPYWEVRCSWLSYNFSSSRVALKYGKHDAFFRLVSLSSMRHTSSPKQKRGMQKACLVSKCHVKYKPRLEEPWIRVVVFPTFTHGRHFFGGHDPSRTLRFLSHTWADWQLQVQRPNCPPVGYWILVIDRSQEIEVKHCFFYQQIVGFKFVWIWKI